MLWEKIHIETSVWFFCCFVFFFPQPKAMKHIWLFDVSGCGSPRAEPEEVGQPHWPGSHNQHAILECVSPHNSVPQEAENGKQTAKKTIYFLSFFGTYILYWAVQINVWFSLDCNSSLLLKNTMHVFIISNTCWIFEWCFHPNMLVIAK